MLPALSTIVVSTLALLSAPPPADPLVGHWSGTLEWEQAGKPASAPLSLHFERDGENALPPQGKVTVAGDARHVLPRAMRWTREAKRVVLRVPKGQAMQLVDLKLNGAGLEGRLLHEEADPTEPGWSVQLKLKRTPIPK